MHRAYCYLKSKFKKSSGNAMISTNYKEAYGGTLPFKNEELIKRYAAHLNKVDEKLDSLETVQDFPKGYEWLNTKDDKPFSLNKELRGKIVVIDFWSSCCINCIHVLAEMDYLEHTFKDFK